MAPSAHIFFGVYLGVDGLWAGSSGNSYLPEWTGDGDEIKFSELMGVERVGWVSKNEDPQWHVRWLKWLDTKRKAIEECPVKLVRAGYEWSCIALAVRETYVFTDWDYNPMTLDVKMIREHSEETWCKQLDEWCRKLGLGTHQVVAANPKGPRWMVMTSGVDG